MLFTSCNFIMWLIVFEICILQVDLASKKAKLPFCDYYYDMKYTVPYLTFSNIVNGKNDVVFIDD